MPEAFERFLRWLSPDRDLAVKKYGEIMQKMVKYFVRKGCSEPEDLAAETRDRIIEILNGPIEYPIPEALFYGVANKIWHEELRKPKPEPLPDEGRFLIPEPTIDKELQAYCLTACLAKLSGFDQDLITRYYDGQGRSKIEARRLLAAACGGENNLRIKTCRIRHRLRNCMEICMLQQQPGGMAPQEAAQ
jgi:hypothetical protein